MKLATMNYSERDGEGHVRFNQKYRDMPNDVIKLDILQDWVEALVAAYDETHKEVFPRKRKE